MRGGGRQPRGGGRPLVTLDGYRGTLVRLSSRRERGGGKTWELFDCHNTWGAPRDTAVDGQVGAGGRVLASQP